VRLDVGRESGHRVEEVSPVLGVVKMLPNVVKALELAAQSAVLSSERDVVVVTVKALESAA
jgi:hypothetical protein